MNEIGSITVGIRGDATDLIDAAHSAEAAIETLNDAVIQLRRQTSQIYMPEFAYKFKNDFYNRDKAVFNNADKTGNLSVHGKLEYWQEMLGKYSYDSYAVMEIEEKIFALFRELTKSANVLSENYISERNNLNDWESFGDDAISAFERVKAQNIKFAQQGIISWGEYYDTVNNLGEQMYRERIKQSKEWLEQEYKYNNLSVDDYISGLERMNRYTEEYYDNNIISYAEFADGKRVISNKIADMTEIKRKQTEAANAKLYSDWKNSSSGYMEQRELYDDWDKFGDSKVDFYSRCIERQKEFFSQGIIDWETYNGAVIQYTMQLYKAQYSEFEYLTDVLLKAQKSYIDGVDAEYSKSIGSFKSKHNIEKTDNELEYANSMKKIYKNAVTEKGKDRLKEYSDKAYELEYQKELYTREADRSKVISELKSRYEAIEKDKEAVLRDIMNGSISINDITARLSDGIFSECGSIQEILSKILYAVNNSKRVVYGPTNYNISGADTSVFKKFVKDASGRLSAAMR